MTDEKLIEEAKKAVNVAKDAIWRTSPDFDGEAHLIAMLDRMLAVFEKAHAPAGDEHVFEIGGMYRVCTTCGLADFQHAAEPQGEPSDAYVRPCAHTGPGHASGDAGYCEGCLAEREQRAAGLIPGEPFTLDDLAREHERLAEHPNQMKQTIPAFHSLTAKALRWAALRAAGGVR